LVQNNRKNNQQPGIILGQAAGYCSHYFGSGCWLLITLSWTWLLVIFPIILDQAVGYCSNDFGSGYPK
jgi:hypothetical protein